MPKAEFFSPPPEALTIHRLIQQEFGSALRTKIRFSDFWCEYDHPSLFDWVRKLGLSANQATHPSLIFIRAGQAVARSNLLPEQQKKLAVIAPLHDVGEILLFDWLGVGDVADPNKTELSAKMETGIFNLVILKTALKEIGIDTNSIIEPLKQCKSHDFKDRTAAVQNATLQLAKMASQHSEKPLIKESMFILQAYDEIVVNQTSSLGQFFRTIEVFDYLQTALNTVRNNGHNGLVLAAEVMQFAIPFLLQKLNQYPFVKDFLYFLDNNFQQANSIEKTFQQIGKSLERNPPEIIINKKPASRQSKFNPEKFAAVYSQWQQFQTSIS